jgi:hypothetical protein
MSTRYDPTLMTAKQYNKIKLITPTPPFDNDTIAKAGEIFRRHSMTDRYSALYVHRHWDMPDNSIAFQVNPSDDVEITKFTPLDSLSASEIAGTAFKLNETGNFQAFEYSASVGQPTFSSSFLEEYAQFIIQRGLQDRLGIAAISAENTTTQEINVPDEKLSIVFPSKEFPDLVSQSVSTSWVFHGEISVRTGCIICHKSKSDNSVGSVCIACHAQSVKGGGAVNCGGCLGEDIRRLVGIALSRRGIIL